MLSREEIIESLSGFEYKDWIFTIETLDSLSPAEQANALVNGGVANKVYLRMEPFIGIYQPVHLSIDPLSVEDNDQLLSFLLAALIACENYIAPLLFPTVNGLESKELFGVEYGDKNPAGHYIGNADKQLGILLDLIVDDFTQDANKKNNPNNLSMAALANAKKAANDVDRLIALDELEQWQ